MVIGLACLLPANVLSLQVISPSTSPNTHRRNMSAAGLDESGNQVQNAEPSRQLMLTLDSMIPFDVVGSDIEELLQVATRTFLTGSTAEAVLALEELRKQNPELPPVPSMIANMLYGVGNRNGGRQWLEKSAMDFPNHPTAFLGFARFSVAEKRIADAEAMLTWADLLIQKGTWTEGQSRMFRIEYLDVFTDIYVNRQRLEKARDCLLELKTLLKDNGKIPVRLAQIEFDLKNVDASLGYLNDAIKLNESIRMPEVVLSDWFMRKKDYVQSEEWINTAANKYPDDVSVQIDFGRWLLQNERITQASLVVQKAEQLGGNEYVVGYLKGQIAFVHRAYDQAEIQFEQLLKLKPRDADATNMLALSLIESLETSKHGRALELALINQRLYPKSPTAMATLGWIYYRYGKTAEAEKAFRAVVASNNLAPVAAFYVASYLNQRGDYPGAKNLLEQAVASQEYFMFRNAAKELLKVVSAKMPTPTETPIELPSTGDSPDDGKDEDKL